MKTEEKFLEIKPTTSGRVHVSVPGVWSKRMPLKEAEKVAAALTDAAWIARMSGEND